MHHVVYCLDKNYQQHFAASIASLVSSYKGSRENLNVYVVTDNIDDSIRIFTEKFSKRESIRILLIHLSEGATALLDLVPKKFRNIKGYLNISTYFRILLPLVMPENVNNIVYLDSDTIIIDDISKLLSIDIGNYAMGAALDVQSSRISQFHGIESYFNTGVILMNLPEMRFKRFSERCIEYMSDKACKSLFADQCAINIVMSKDIYQIPERWNVYATNYADAIASADNDMKKASIIHFITKDKPWHDWYQNKLGDLYWKNLHASQWPAPISISPKTVDEHHAMARKLGNQGQFEDAISMYEKIIKHLAGKLNALARA